MKKRKTTHPAVAGEDDVNIINDFGGPGENTGVGYDGMEDINDAGALRHNHMYLVLSLDRS